MARIKKFAPEQNLSSFQTFLVDENPNSDYFRITEFKDTFTGGKNGFLIEGSQYLKESTEIKVELLDVNGDPIYYEPGNGIPEYYEGISKLIAVYIYEDTPIGLGKITILGELKQYDDNGVIRDIPTEWEGAYNVKWERTFQINKNLANEDRVRFYRRPKVTIDEIVKPIYTKTPQTITKSGEASGIPLIPIENESLTNFSLPTSYRLRIADDNNWTGSMINQPITFDGLGYTATIDDIISNREVIVSPPYSDNGLVKSFTSQSYSIDFPYLEGAVTLATALTGSFAKINITDMKTFVGDAARVKVFRRSQSQLSDYEFVQEIQLESNELLRDLEATASNEEYYGNLTQDRLSAYWSGSAGLTTTLNQTFLYNSVELDTATDSEYFYTKNNINVQSDVEYNLSFNVRKADNTSSDDSLRAFISGTLNGIPSEQTITTIPSSNSVLQKNSISENFVADSFESSSLYFEVVGDNWYINDISLKAAQETAFSPDEITFIQSVPKTLTKETFDYRFEFYDINNNYIPVLVEKTKTFDGGNLNLFKKDLTLSPNQLYFSFDSASSPSNPLPPFNIFINVEKTVITGSVTFTSGAYDQFGNLLDSSDYIGGQYPGLLTDRNSDIVKLNVADFTGSRDDITVQYIEFTGEAEGETDSFVITRVQDGKGGVNFEIRPYRGTIIKNKEDKTLEIQAIRIDGINEINLKSNLPQTGWSDAKLRVQSGSEYITLSEAVSTGFLVDVRAGTTGSGEIDYNAEFGRLAINGQLPIYLMDGDTQNDILAATLVLSDLQDGLTAGFVRTTTDQFNINPKEETTFTPQSSTVTGNFYLRGTNQNPISGSLVVYPSMSIDESLLPHYYMFYDTGAFDSRISVNAFNGQNQTINSGVPGGSVTYYEAIESKQLTLNFTYTEDITSESISVDKTLFIVPDGLGTDAISVNVDPLIINLNSNQQGVVYDYTPLDTTVSIKQGYLDLRYTGSQKPGTFYTSSIVPTNIAFASQSFDTYNLFVSGFQDMTSSLVASVDYNLVIYPFYTSSFVNQSVRQRITKGVDGSDAIEIIVEPQSVNFSANEGGVVADYTLANTDVVVKQGNLYLSYEDTELPGTFTASFSASGITIGQISASSQFNLDFGDETLHFTNFSGMTAQSASIDYYFRVFPYSLTNGVAGVEEQYTRKQLFSKSNDGSAGRTVKLATTTDVVHFDGDGVVTSPLTPITLTATAYNTSGSLWYQFYRDGSPWTSVTQTNFVNIASGDATEIGQVVTWEVRLRDGGPTANVVATDQVSITGIQDGPANYTVQLANPASTVTVEVDGTTYLGGTGNSITVFKGTQQLDHVTFYNPFDATYDDQGNFIGNLGEYSASVFSTSDFITQNLGFTGNPAQIQPIQNWNLPQDNPVGSVVYKVDIENGRATYYVSHSLAASFEGAIGPGLVMRGEWTGSIDYIFDVDAKRRDAVFREISGDVHYWATTATLADAGSPPYTYEPIYNPGSPPSQGDIDANGWQYLGMQDFFVAAKLAIFEESFVKNTINVGIPPAGNQNAQISIVGGTDEPYISIGQGTQGYAQPGVFIGMTNDGGILGTNGTFGVMSLKSVPDIGGSYNSMEWNGESLIIRGAIRQTAAGQIEGSIRGLWQVGVNYYPNDIVTANGQSWIMTGAGHISTVNDEPGVGVNYTTYWEVAASAGTSGLAAELIQLTSNYQSFKELTNGTVIPNSIILTINRQNTSTPVLWSTSPSIDLYDAAIGGSVTTTGDTVYLRNSEFGANTAVTITATAGLLSDETTIVRLVDGTNALTVINTNQSHTFPASNAGVVSDYSNSGTLLKVFEGTTELVYDGVGSGDGTYTVSSSVLPQGSITVGSIGISNDDALVAQHSSMNNGVDTAVITYTLSGNRTNSTAFSVETTQTLTKAKEGVAGTNGSSGVNGTDGAVGDPAGVVYAGEWDISTGGAVAPVVYLAEDSLKYVVKYETVSSTYWICTQTHRYKGAWTIAKVNSHNTSVDDVMESSGTYYTAIQPTTGVGLWDIGTFYPQWSVVRYGGVPYVNKSGYVSPGGSIPPANAAWTTYTITDTDLWTSIGSSIAPGTWTAAWDAFGAEFTSVATDILFAEDVYANRTINIGTGTSGNPVISLNADYPNYENPYISIGQTVQAYGEDGIFLGYSEGTASFSLLTSGSRANIGGWNIDKNGIYFTEDVIIDTAEVEETLLVTNWPIFEPDVTSSGQISVAGKDYRIADRNSLSSVNLEVSSPAFAFSSSISNIEYVSHSFTAPDHWNADWATPPSVAYSFNWEVNGSYGGSLVVDKNTNGLRSLFGSDAEWTAFQNYFTSEPFVSDNKRPIVYFRDNNNGDLGFGSYKVEGFEVESITNNGGGAYDDTLVFYAPGETVLNELITNFGGDDSAAGSYITDIQFFMPVYKGKEFPEYIGSLDVSDYRGEWSNFTYYFTGEVVKSAVTSDYYIAKFDHASTNAATSPPNGASYTSYWNFYSNTHPVLAQVSAFAGHIEDVSGSIESVRIHSSGSNGSPRPYISLGQVTQSYDAQGGFFGYISGSDDVHFSLVSSVTESIQARNKLAWDGATLTIEGNVVGGGLRAGATLEGSAIYVPSINAPSFSVDTEGNVTAESATIRGTIQATDGTIGDWVIDDQTQTLRDSNSEIVFDPNLPEVQLYDITGAKKVRLSPTGGLSEPDISSIVVPNIGTSITTNAVNSSNSSTAIQYSSYANGALSDMFAISSSASYPVVFSVPAISVTSPLDASTYSTNFPTYDATSAGQRHGVTNATRAYRGIQLYIELHAEDDSDAHTYSLLVRSLLATVTSYSAYEVSDYYENTLGGQFSVTGDTLIDLADGTKKKAEDIGGDDFILAWDMELNKLVPTQISQKLQRLVDNYYVVTAGEFSVKVSDNHGFWLDNGEEVLVTDLVVGETEIYVRDGDTIVKRIVDSVDNVISNDINNPTYVYTLSVPKYENYVSDGIISHNAVGAGWEYQGPSYQIAAQTTSLSSTNKSITFNFNGYDSHLGGYSPNYKMRYSIRSYAASGLETNTAGNGTQTYTYNTTSYSNSDLSLGTLDSSIEIDVPSNLTEITAKGVQVLSGPGQYVRLERDANFSNLLQIAGGHIYFGRFGDTSTNGTYSIKPALDGKYDIGTSTYRWYRGYFDQVWVTAGSINSSSDRRLKTNITQSDLGLNFINSLNPVKYNWIDSDNDQREQYGLIAQDVNDLVPMESASFVSSDGSDNLHLAYNQLISPMIKAIQELSEKVNQLELILSGSNS